MAKKRPEWKDSKYADAKGKFKQLPCKELAAWLIKSRKGNKKAIVGSLNQQVVFNRKKKPKLRKENGLC
jgi:phage gpG-like protein